MTPVKRGPSSVAEILKEVLPPGSRKRVFSLELIRLKWTKIVGRELALRSEPDWLGAGVLTVRVNDAAWGRMILKLQREIRARLSLVVGPGVVERIQFVRRERPVWDGSVPGAPSGGQVVESSPPAPVLEAARLIRDPGLRDLVTRAASRYLAAQADRRR